MRTECAAYALDSANDDTGPVYGVWGSLSANQIRQAHAEGMTGADVDAVLAAMAPRSRPKPKAVPTGDALEVDPIFCAGCRQPKPVDEFSSLRRYCDKACKQAAQRQRQEGAEKAERERIHEAVALASTRSDAPPDRPAIDKRHAIEMVKRDP